MSNQSITIRTKGEAEIYFCTEGPQTSADVASLLAPVHFAASEGCVATVGIGHTKILADGTHIDGSDPRTDHVAVIDHSTGLMWAVKSIGDSDGDPMSQADCEKACSGLRLLGHDDWRPPTRSELAALVDDTRHEPAIDSSLFPGVLSRWHWTSTPCAWSSASAWGVDFHDGGVYSLRRSSLGFALAVRRAGQ
ncbi:DUF1566 domain-containing protein [Stenotrophomonas maltophilia]|uniref:Lcl C-terminal domain-containing protein n=1 Tax=Stenotrophomonas maltophilia TaxID=40324 RepID=UPI0007EFCDB4|nr:DUF1566 domain-containing protein [Stenotrophomonas maltophilia]OBU50134.1 hypothetical protein A9K76_07935 [Stenotrophomonas maltophilia]